MLLAKICNASNRQNNTVDLVLWNSKLKYQGDGGCLVALSLLRIKLHNCFKADCLLHRLEMKRPLKGKYRKCSMPNRSSLHPQENEFFIAQAQRLPKLRTTIPVMLGEAPFPSRHSPLPLELVDGGWPVWSRQRPERAGMGGCLSSQAADDLSLLNDSTGDGTSLGPGDPPPLPAPPPPYQVPRGVGKGVPKPWGWWCSQAPASWGQLWVVREGLACRRGGGIRVALGNVATRGQVTRDGLGVTGAMIENLTRSTREP